MSDISDASDASNDKSGSEEPEWNVNQRARRSTAGNRLSTLLSQEAPDEEDDDVQLLFREDDQIPDEEFEAKDSDGDAAEGGDSSSSSDDSDDGADDDLAGEKQLEREERAKKKMQKRKTEQAFMRPRQSKPKRVKIVDPESAATDPGTPESVTAAAPPKKKKKSERVSWLLDDGEHGATRTSSRTLSRQNKERTQASLKESEAKRKRQLAVMEAAHKRRQQQKVKPLTQEDRLREAARTEEINSQSLNRWEEMERDRVDRQRARLEALQNRKLEGPFIRWYTGRAEWVDGKLIHVGRRNVEELEEADAQEQEPLANSNDEDDSKGESGSKPPEVKGDQSQDVGTQDRTDHSLAEDLHASIDTDGAQLSTESVVSGSAAQATAVKERVLGDATPENTSANPNAPADAASDTAQPLEKGSGLSEPTTVDEVQRASPPAPVEEPHQESVEVVIDKSATDPQRGFLDGIDQYAAMHDSKEIDTSQVPADTTHTERPAGGSSLKQEPSQPPSDTNSFKSGTPADTTAASAKPDVQPEVEVIPPAPKETTYSSRQYIQLMNFASPAAMSMDTHRRVLFNLRGPQLMKPTKPTPQLCAVTGQPARYRDPTTGLAYRDSAALQRIKRLTMRDGPRWSVALGAWIGLEEAAAGVPPGFIASETIDETSTGVKEQVVDL